MASHTSTVPSSKVINSFSDTPFLRALRRPSQRHLNTHRRPSMLKIAVAPEPPPPPQTPRSFRIPIAFDKALGLSLEAVEAERNLLLLEEVFSGLVRWRCFLENAEA